MADPVVDVVVQIAGGDLLAGRLWGHRRGRHESATFAYAPEYIEHPHAYELDPLLPLVTGQLQTPVGRPIFGAFSDCAPDRWGRRLMQRAERQRAEAEGGTERSFGDVDYLLGVRDDLRQGALRFRSPGETTYLADEHRGVPTLLELSALLTATEHLERDEATDEDIQALLRGGSSLGGARPKAHVIGPGGRIAIAKFPSRNDDWDVMRWEAVTLELAGAAGISVPRWALHTLDGKAVLIVDRFDRSGERRIGYVSAMTMLEAADHEQASYVDIAEAIEERSPAPSADLRELWRRIAFSILVSNTDDHLRNHGFLRTSTAGWSLSPAFDLNPNPQPGSKHLSTAIGSDTTAAIEPLMDVAELFGLGRAEAGAVLREVVESTRHWRLAAARVGLGSTAISEMAPAFEHEQSALARNNS